MHNEKYVIKIYRAIFMIASLIIGIMTIVNHKMYGEGVGIKLSLSNIELIMILIVDVAMIYLSIPVFDMTKRSRYKVRTLSAYRFTFSPKIHIFIFLILLLQILFTIRTGNGVVGADYSASGTLISYIFNVLKISAFMPIYYVAARATKRTIYWANVVLWIIYSLMCGWTGLLMTVPFLELFLRAKEGKINVAVKTLYRMSTLTAITATLIGGWLYKYAYALKNSIRYGYQVGTLTYIEGLERLISRFTGYPLNVVAVVNHNKITALYQSQGIMGVDIKSIFRSLIPSSIMDKNFRTMHNIIIQSMYEDLPNSTGSNYGLPFYWYNLMESGVLDFVIYLLFTIIFMAITRAIIYSFDDGSGKTDILYYFVIVNFMMGLSPESMYGYGYFGLVYFIPIMVLFGVIKIKRKKVAEREARR